MAKTNVHEFLEELDAGIFENKLATALSEVALVVLNNDKQGTVRILLRHQCTYIKVVHFVQRLKNQSQHQMAL